MYVILLIVCKVLANALTAASGVYGLLTEFKDKQHKITRAGKVALGGIILGFAFSGGITYLETRKAAQDDQKHKQELAEQKAQLSSLQTMAISQTQALQSQTETLQQIILLLAKPQVEMLPSGRFVANLSWKPSASTNIIGYNVYRSPRAGGPYIKVNAFPVTKPSFADATVVSGTSYYYVMTAVDSEGRESRRSNEVAVVIP